MKNLTNLLENFKNYEEKLNKSTKTIEGYLKEARYFMKDYNINSVEDLKIMESKEFWTQWLEDMTSKYQAGTVNKKKTALSVFSKFLIFQEIIETNKVQQIESLKNDNKKIEVYSTDEKESILNLLNEKCDRKTQRNIDQKVNVMYKAIFNMFFSLALRNEEVTNIRISDINWENGMMYVRCKGHKGEISHKSKMNNETLSIVKEWLEIRNTINTNEDYLFVSPLSKKQISTDAIRKQMRLLQKELGIEGDLMIHSIRHTKASELVSKGADIKKVSMFLHHSSQKTTESFYCHNTEEMLEELSNL
jgi:site-specific recombinase XerD